MMNQIHYNRAKDQNMHHVNFNRTTLDQDMLKVNYNKALYLFLKHSTVVPTKSDSNVILCLQLLS